MAEDFRGQDGWIEVNTDLFGGLKSFDISLKQEMLDRTTMPGNFKRVRGGLKSGTGRASALFDYGDAAQKQLVDSVITSTGLSFPAAFHTTDGKVISGNILALEFSPKGSTTTSVMVDFSFEFDGEYSIAWG